jgi:hypothetical protein
MASEIGHRQDRANAPTQYQEQRHGSPTLARWLRIWLDHIALASTTHVGSRPILCNTIFTHKYVQPLASSFGQRLNQSHVHHGDLEMVAGLRLLTGIILTMVTSRIVMK